MRNNITSNAHVIFNAKKSSMDQKAPAMAPHTIYF